MILLWYKSCPFYRPPAAGHIKPSSLPEPDSGPHTLSVSPSFSLSIPLFLFLPLSFSCSYRPSRCLSFSGSPGFGPHALSATALWLNTHTHIHKHRHTLSHTHTFRHTHTDIMHMQVADGFHYPGDKKKDPHTHPCTLYSPMLTSYARVICVIRVLTRYRCP